MYKTFLYNKIVFALILAAILLYPKTIIYHVVAVMVAAVSVTAAVSIVLIATIYQFKIIKYKNLFLPILLC